MVSSQESLGCLIGVCWGRDSGRVLRWHVRIKDGFALFVLRVKWYVGCVYPLVREWLEL